MTEVRCFVAVDLPEGMREEVGRLQQQIALEGLRLVRPELVHITLKFLGEIPEGMIEPISQALGTVKERPFQAGVKGMGAFPGRSIRVVWLGLEGDFESLQQKVEAALRPLGLRRDKRGFSPHVTIARVGRPSPDLSRRLAPVISSLAGVDLGSFRVERFLLKKSTLTPGGPIYDDLAEFPLPDSL
jgi:2'-5' RNA ligase